MMTDPQQPADSISTIFTAYRFAVGFGVPFAIVIIGILGKKVSRGPNGGWGREDFYAGTELTLTGISGALVNLFEFMKADQWGSLQKKLLAGNIGITILGLIFYYLTLSLAQDFGPKGNKSKKMQLFVMAGVSNVLGLLTLVGALFLMAS